MDGDHSGSSKHLSFLKIICHIHTQYIKILLQKKQFTDNLIKILLVKSDFPVLHLTVPLAPAALLVLVRGARHPIQSEICTVMPKKSCAYLNSEYTMQIGYALSTNVSRCPWRPFIKQIEFYAFLPNIYLFSSFRIEVGLILSQLSRIRGKKYGSSPLIYLAFLSFR